MTHISPPEGSLTIIAGAADSLLCGRSPLDGPSFGSPGLDDTAVSMPRWPSEARIELGSGAVEGSIQLL